MILFLILSCEEKTYENPVDPDTELGADEWAPSNLSIEILTDSDVKLSWQKSEIEATGFKIDRQDTVGGLFVEVGLSDTTIYTDTALLTGNEYLYQVCAYSGDNKSSYALSDTIVTTFPAPYEMSAVPDTNSMIVLAWSDSTAYESGFVIERKNIVSDAFTVLDSTQANTYQDTVITLGNQYVYKVGAYSEYNTSSYTDTALVKYWLDCLNTWGGDAYYDNCGDCVGGDTGETACVQDCNDEWGGDAVEDCAGVCGGDAVDSDGDGICDIDETVYGCTNPSACNFDATATIFDDSCWSATEGCACSDGEGAVADDCFTCDTDTSNDCVQDCAGTWGGEAVFDVCGTCDDNSSNDCVLDCYGAWGGNATNCTVIDLDGNGYETIIIGTQEWLKQNLKVTKYKDGSEIPYITNFADWPNAHFGATGFCSDYDTNPTNSETYGRLYPWYTVDDSRGVCPAGWHVPSDEEFKELEIFLGMSESEANIANWRGTDEGSKLAGNADLWNNCTVCDGDFKNSEFGTSGFSAIPAGHTSNCSSGSDDTCINKESTLMGKSAFFWTTSTDNNSNGMAWIRRVAYDDSDVLRYHYDKLTGMSIRCLKSVDCAGVENGTATVDNCGDCVGGDTGADACVQDCNDEWGGTEPDTDGDGICDIWETVTDSDGNTYTTVLIGDQLWMQENLKVTKYKDGSEIPNITNNGDWGSLTTGAYGDYDNNPTNSETYGRLYNWYAAESQQLCMEGWHIPTNDEFGTLRGVGGGKLKDTGTIEDGDGLWYSPNEGATNESGFTGLPAGSRSENGASGHMGLDAEFWSSTDRTSISIWCMRLSHDYSYAKEIDFNKYRGISVRCLKD